jgi:hypothetical protein
MADNLVIDLRPYWLPLVADIERALRAFREQHADVRISTVALYGDGFHGAAHLHLDTASHSAAFVQRWAGQGGSLQDAAGTFCRNCPDFEFAAGDFSFAGYPDFYEIAETVPLSFVSLDGVRSPPVDPDMGDEGKHEHVFALLKRVLASFGSFAALSRSTPFRAGVQMIDSRYIKFWLLDR